MASEGGGCGCPSGRGVEAVSPTRYGGWQDGDGGWAGLERDVPVALTLPLSWRFWREFWGDMGDERRKRPLGIGGLDILVQ